MAYNDHIVSQIKDSTLLHDNVLHVVGVVSNPARFHSRYRLFRQWMAEMEATPNVVLYVVELAYGDRRHEVTDSTNPRHLQLRSDQMIWHKESMINLGVRELLPTNWKYLCWCDGDVSFRNPDWAQETMHQLQHYPVVQPWQHAVDLGFHGEILSTFDSFCSLHKRGVQMQRHPGEPYKYAHSGFAWACTRSFFEQARGLMDFPILGSADHHQAWAMIGHVDSSIHAGMGPEFKRRCHEWQRNAFMITRGNLGFTPGRIEHNFHGPKHLRKYRERWQLFIDNKFNPDTQLMYDSQGLIRLINNPGLEREIAQYLTQRNEDSIESAY